MYWGHALFIESRANALLLQYLPYTQYFVVSFFIWIMCVYVNVYARAFTWDKLDTVHTVHTTKWRVIPGRSDSGEFKFF